MFKSTTIDKKYQNKVLNVEDYHLDAENVLTASYLSYNLGLAPDYIKSYNSWLSINDQLYYYKCFEIFNELFLSELAREFDLKSLDFKFANFKDKLGIMSKSFKEKGKKYFDYDYYFADKNLQVPRNLLALNKTFSKLMTDENRQELMNSIYRLTVFDFFCGQTDRGDTNLIFEVSDKVKLTPIFDNGSSMYFPHNKKNRADILFSNYYSSFDNLYFPTDNYINRDVIYILDLINNNEEFYNYLCKALDINLTHVLRRTIDKYKLVVPMCDRKELHDYFTIKKRIIYNTLTLAKSHK